MQDFGRTGGNRDSTPGGHTQSSVHIRTQAERAVTPKETEPALPASVGGSPAEARGGSCGSLRGQGHWQQKFWEVLLGVSPPRVAISPTKELGRLQSWVTSGQPTNREGTQPHPSADKPIKVLLNSAHQSNTQLYPPPVPPSRKLAQAS